MELNEQFSLPAVAKTLSLRGLGTRTIGSCLCSFGEFPAFRGGMSLINNALLSRRPTVHSAAEALESRNVPLAQLSKACRSRSCVFNDRAVPGDAVIKRLSRHEGEPNPVLPEPRQCQRSTPMVAAENSVRVLPWH